jgi:peroxiredoxin
MGRLIALLLAAIAACHAEQTAESVLEKVAEVYSTARTLRLELVHKSQIIQAGNSVSGEEAIRIALERPGRLWLSVKGSSQPAYLVVNDGEAQWTYIPSQKQYAREEIAALGDDDEDQGPQEGRDPVAEMLRIVSGRYEVLARLAPYASILKQDTLKVAGQRTPCVVVAIDLPSSRIHREIWVDQSRFLVLSDREVRQVPTRWGPTQMEEWLVAKAAEVNAQLEPGTFTFEPHDKARKVDFLAIPGSSGRVSFAGRRAPDFTLKDIEGNQVSLASLRGKVVLLDFWATRCGPCLREMPILNKLSEELQDKGLVVLGVNDEGAGEVRGFLKKHQYSLTVLDDSRRTVFKLYGASAIPSLLVIGRDGIVARHFVGSRGEAELRAALQAAGLAQNPGQYTHSPIP